VDVRRAQPEERPVVPVQAVQNDKSGQFVLLVGPDNKVRQQYISRSGISSIRNGSSPTG
jgi:membrane fusion protein (multidrug efflux system)